MTSSHPTSSTLERFAHNRLPAEQIQRIQRHLLVCESCEEAYLQVVFLAVSGEPGGRSFLLGGPEGRSEQDYQRAIEQVVDRARAGLIRAARCAEAEARDARRQQEALLALPAPLRADRIAEDPDFHSRALCEQLIRACRVAEFEAPREALELAELAVWVAGHLDPRASSEATLQDLRARSWGALANAHRVLGDFAGAEQAFETAERHLSEGSGDPHEEAHLLSLKASLRRLQMRFPEALDLLDQALQLYRLLGEHRLVGRTLIKRGVVLGHADRPQEAVEALREGLAKIDPAADPRLDLSGRHNLVCFLLDAGRLLEAQALLAQTRRLHYRHASPLNLVRLRWLEGRLAVALDQPRAAEEALLEVRDGFLRHGLGKDAAVAALELAEIYARERSDEAMQRLAEEMLPIFQSPDVHREALAALILFQQEALRRRASLELVQQVLAEVERSQARRSRDGRH